MVQYYDPDRARDGRVAPPEPPAETHVDHPAFARARSDAPVVELVVLGAALALNLGVIWVQGRTFGMPGFGPVFLFQSASLVTSAVITAAVVSLMVRRMWRRRDAALSAELGHLRTELASLHAELSGDGGG